MKMSKRAWALLLALVLTAGNILTASAAASPHSDPVVYDYDEKYKLIITPGDQADTIYDGGSRSDYYTAQAQAMNCPLLCEFLPIIIPYAEALGVAPESCYASGGFDITYYRDYKSYMKKSTKFDSVMVNLNGYNLSRFVCLLHYQHGYWSVVDDAVADPSTNTLSFSANALSPFVVVSYREGTVPKKSGGEGITSPQTGYDAVTEGCLFLKEWFAEFF